MSQLETSTTFHGVLGRVISGQSAGMPQEVARYWASFTLPTTEQSRLNHLAEKNRVGNLDPSEQSELNEFIEVVELIDLFKAQALKTLSELPDQ